MNLHPLAVLAVSVVLCCLPAAGFALRGFALMRVTRNPGRLITVSGVVAMISMWLLAGLTPYVAYEFAKIYTEFGLELPWMTSLTLSLFELPIRLGAFWWPFAFMFGLGALLVPEILFYRPRSS